MPAGISAAQTLAVIMNIVPPLIQKGRCRTALFLLPHGSFLCTSWFTFLRHVAHLALCVRRHISVNLCQQF